MKRSGLAVAGFWLLLSIAVPSPVTFAETTTTDAKPTPPKKKSTKTKVKKSKSKPKPVASAKKPKSNKKTLAAMKPRKPAAEIPLVTEASSVWRGCLEIGGVTKLASGLGMDATHLTSLLSDEGLHAYEGGACIPYVAATGGESGVASAIFESIQPKSGEPPMIAIRKTADGVTATPGACDCAEPASRTLEAPVSEMADAQNELVASLPANVRWQLGVLAPHMIARLSSGKAPSANAVASANSEPSAIAGHSGDQADPSAASWLAASDPEATADLGADSYRGTDAYIMRVVLERKAADAPEHLRAIEIVENATGKRVDGVWWLARPDGPGVFIGMDGVAYERLLWQSPVKYVRKGRGVGPALTTFRRRVAAIKNGSKTMVSKSFTSREYHLGTDMSAPKGEDVHAVADSTVAFAGRKAGFGKLIILDHGRGYQTYYAHLSTIEPGIKAGAAVSGGELIGLVGSTGHSTGPHLHFETRKDGRFIDPFDDTHQLDFWLLSADDQERLAMQLLGPVPSPSASDADGVSQPMDPPPSPAVDIPAENIPISDGMQSAQ